MEAEPAATASEVARIATRIASLSAEAVAANKRLVNSRYERAGFRPGQA
jgi:hypothetical protein